MCNVEPAPRWLYRDGVRILIRGDGRGGKRRKGAGRGVDMKCTDRPGVVIRDVHGRPARQLTSAYCLGRTTESRGKNHPQEEKR